MAVRDVVQAAAGVGGGGEYVEDVFSTYLYDGVESSLAINNGLDLAGEGGMVWIKRRNGSSNHSVVDSERGNGINLYTNLTNGNSNNVGSAQELTSTGFYLPSSWGVVNGGGRTLASWSFRKAPKFFDVVTWTGDDTTNRTHAHNLGSVPGLIIVKATSRSSNWTCYHRSLGNTKGLSLNSTDAAYNTTAWNSTSPTDSVFTATSGTVNEGGQTYVAYLFAHDAGGFGDDGEQNIISCGSYTTNGDGEAEVNLGWEAQFTIIKQSDGANAWRINDSMRGAPVGQTQKKLLSANTADAESNSSEGAYPTATGFAVSGHATFSNYIYIAIRRPMKTPESGTEVFAIDTSGATAPTPPAFNSGFPVDMAFYKQTDGSSGFVSSRLTSNAWMALELTQAETANAGFTFDFQDGWRNNTQIAAYRYSWMFRRAPGFMDVVAYTGTGSNLTLPHNLTVAPELVIAKVRNTSSSWGVSTSTDWAKYLLLNSTNAQASASLFGTPDATNFYPTASGGFSGSGNTYVAYLFATLDGVSKVGSYTGTGADLNVDCGFSAGARFILIKRTDSTGDWYVWDSARGIVAGNDPYLLLNSTAAEVTSTDYIDPLSSGFTVTSSAPAALNASGGSYIFLAIS